MLSEEPLEACNKTIRKNEIEHARQNDHTNRNKDVALRQMRRSDPLILNEVAKRRKPHSRKIHNHYPDEILDIAKPPEVYCEPITVNDDTVAKNDDLGILFLQD